MKTIPSAYNSRMRRVAIAIFVVVCTATVASPQSHDVKQPPSAIELPKASLWSQYSFQFQPADDKGPHHWHAVNGILPRGLTLEDSGRLSGLINEQQDSHFAVIEVNRFDEKQLHNCILRTETPLTAAWGKKCSG